jgi:hypothetical protein
MSQWHRTFLTRCGEGARDEAERGRREAAARHLLRGHFSLTAVQEAVTEFDAAMELQLFPATTLVPGSSSVLLFACNRALDDEPWHKRKCHLVLGFNYQHATRQWKMPRFMPVLQGVESTFDPHLTHDPRHGPRCPNRKRRAAEEEAPPPRRKVSRAAAETWRSME